ncbi:MAG: hypothetical protein IH908_07620 [Proteobacteria bacterium]|nr:hypothetical protein [Pseudomonadota bacterium]
MSEQAYLTITIKNRPSITFRAIALLISIVTLAASGFYETGSEVENSAVDIEVFESYVSLDKTLTKNELSFLVNLNASEEAGITELLSELEDWTIQPHQLKEVLREFVLAKEIGLSRRTSSGFENLNADETDELLATFTTVDDPGYFLFLTAAGFSRWEIEDWGITAKRSRFLMFASDPRSVRVSGETRGGA